MASYGCPLCCQQKFNSIVALREHLLYFTFRPLLCVLCRMTIGGIYELTQHLETHLIKERNSTADVLRNVREMDDENFLSYEVIEYDACNNSEIVTDDIVADICDKKKFESEIQCKNSELFASSKSENLDRDSNMHVAKLTSCTKLTNLNTDNQEILEEFVDDAHTSISETNSEIFCSESDQDNLSICNISERENLENNQESNSINFTEGDVVRAYACNECGAKIVGKDFYFNHLQEHSDKSLNMEIGNMPLPDILINNYANINSNEIDLNPDNILNKEDNVQQNANILENANNIYKEASVGENELNQTVMEMAALESDCSIHYEYARNTVIRNDDPSTSSETVENYLSQPNTTISNAGSSSMQHYIHKKFDHDQERKFEGLSSNSDVQCYIQNFQSLLVNKLNQAFESNALETLPDPENGLEGEEEVSINDSPQVGTSTKSERKYHCRYCTKQFVWKQTRDTHELNRKCSTVNVCKHCNKEFSQNNTLSRHEQETHNNKIFSCKECGSHFKSTRYLTNHKGVHDKKRYACSQCPSYFHTASGLRSHKCEAHSVSKKGKEISCKHCGEKFKRKYGLQRHIERKHSLTKFSCKYCNKEFACKEDLSSHMIIHLNSESLSCSICDMPFTSHSSLKRHKEKHKNAAKSFQCKTCLALFTRKDSLISHMQTKHTSNQKYICKCGKAFNKASHLKYHAVKHSEGPPQFRCELCLKTFKYKISLKKHHCKEKIV